MAFGRSQNKPRREHDGAIEIAVKRATAPLYAQIRELRGRVHTMEVEWDRVIARLNRAKVRDYRERSPLDEAGHPERIAADGR